MRAKTSAAHKNSRRKKCTEKISWKERNPTEKWTKRYALNANKLHALALSALSLVKHCKIIIMTLHKIYVGEMMMLFFLPLIPSLGNALSDACIHLQLVSASACLSLCILHENSLRSARPSFAIKHSQKLAETFTCVTFECEQGIHTASKQIKKKKREIHSLLPYIFIGKFSPSAFYKFRNAIAFNSTQWMHYLFV